MNSRRTLLIAVALVLAALAFIANIYYLRSADERAAGDAELVEVFKIKQPVPKGLAGDLAIEQGYVGSGKIPQEYRPGNAITSVDDIRNLVAINDLAPGQVLVDGQFVSRDIAQVTNAQTVGAGEVAVSISVDRVRGVAGLLLPGDKVNMLVVNEGRVETLYQNAEIMAIGGQTAAQPGEQTDEAETGATAAAADAGLITFSVPLEAAQRIAFVQASPDTHSFYLTLVQPENQPVAKPAPADEGNLFSVDQTPYPVN